MSDTKVFIKKNFDFLMNPFLTKARISSISRINPAFMILKFQLLALESKKCNTGDKINIEIGEHRDRSYTPFGFDEEEKSLKIICFRRENAPSGHWLGGLKVGDNVQFFGPRSSLTLNFESVPIAVFGDETTLGLMRSLTDLYDEAELFVETSFPMESTEALAALGLHGQTYMSLPEQFHLNEIGKALVSKFIMNPRTIFVLTGRMLSIKKLRAELLKRDIPSSKIKTKIYWSDGRAGLD